MPKGVRRKDAAGADSPPDMQAWFATGPDAPLPAAADRSEAGMRIQYLFNLARAGHAQGRRVSYANIVAWHAAGPFNEVLTVQQLAGRFHYAVRKNWAECPGERIFFLPHCGEHILLDGGLSTVTRRRTALAAEYGCGLYDPAVTEKVLEGALAHAANLKAAAGQGDMLGASQREAAVRIAREVLGPMFGRERWTLPDVGFGLLRLLQRHQAAAVFDNGVLLHRDPRMPVLPDEAFADLYWVSVPGLRCPTPNRLPERWRRALLLPERVA